VPIGTPRALGVAMGRVITRSTIKYSLDIRQGASRPSTPQAALVSVCNVALATCTALRCAALELRCWLLCGVVISSRREAPAVRHCAAPQSQDAVATRVERRVPDPEGFFHLLPNYAPVPCEGVVRSIANCLGHEETERAQNSPRQAHEFELTKYGSGCGVTAMLINQHTCRYVDGHTMSKAQFFRKVGLNRAEAHVIRAVALEYEPHAEFSYASATVVHEDCPRSLQGVTT